MPLLKTQDLRSRGLEECVCVCQDRFFMAYLMLCETIGSLLETHYLFLCITMLMKPCLGYCVMKYGPQVLTCEFTCAAWVMNSRTILDFAVASTANVPNFALLICLKGVTRFGLRGYVWEWLCARLVLRAFTD